MLPDFFVLKKYYFCSCYDIYQHLVRAAVSRDSVAFFLIISHLAQNRKMKIFLKMYCVFKKRLYLCTRNKQERKTL